jgi:hypothetical protein
VTGVTDVPGGPPPAAKRPARTGAGGPSPARPGTAPGDTGTRRARRAVTTTYRVEKPAKAGPLAVAGKAVVAAVFAATAALAVYRADRPAATPHKHVPDVILTGGWALVALLAVVLTAAALAWVRRGSRFADALAFVILWPIATVLMAIVAALSLVPQHYLRPGPVLAPAGIAAVVMMVAVAVVYNRAPRR